MYNFDQVFRDDGIVIPYVKWQTFRGGWKAATNNPKVAVDELEIGIEYQIMKALEITLAYTEMDRTNVSNLGQANGTWVDCRFNGIISSHQQQSL